MAQWLGYALWLSAWLVLVLGQAWAQSRPLCEVVNVDRSGLPSSSDFDSFGICSTMRMCGDQDSRQGEHGSWAGRYGGRVSGLRPSSGLCPVVQVSSARVCHCPPIAADGQCRGARVWYVYALCGCLQVKPRAG